MRMLEEGLRKAGMKLEGNNTLPKDKRNVKSFQLLIQTMRGVEADVQKQLDEAQAEINRHLSRAVEQQTVIMDQQAEIDRLQKILLKQSMKVELDKVHGLSVGDRTRVLEVIDNKS